MKVKGQVMRCLKSKGILATKNELGLNFTYQGWNFLLWNDADDPLFFRLALPGVFDVTDENYAKSIMACNNVNWNFKVVKAVLYEFDDGHDSGASIWMCFEQSLDSVQQVDNLLPRAMHSLLSAAEVFMKEVADEK